MTEHKIRTLRKRYQIAKVLQFLLCLVFLLWLNVTSTTTSPAQAPSLEVIQERMTHLTEADADTKRLVAALAERQIAVERKVDSVYSVGTTLMTLLVVISGYVAITGKKLRTQDDGADRK